MGVYRSIKKAKLLSGVIVPTIKDYFRPKGTVSRSSNKMIVNTPRSRGARRIVRGIPRGLAMRVHTFKRLGQVITLGSNGSAIDINGLAVGNTGVALGAIVGGNVINTNNFGFAMSFALGNVAQYGEIQSLFDNYRIKMVKLRFDYSYNSAPSAIGTINQGTGPTSQSTNWQSQSIPRMHFTPDPDDSIPPNDRNEVLANSYAKAGRLDQTIYCTIRPRYQNTVVGSVQGVGGGLGPANSWLDCQSPNIAHHGFKAYMVDMPQGMKDTTSNQYQWTLTITPTYYIDCKNVV